MSVTAEIQPLRLAADAEFRLPRDRNSRRGRVRSGAIIAAALVHVAVIAALLLSWPFAPVEKPPPPPIPVALVMVPPPAPPKPVPKPLPKPAPPAHDLVSGPDEKTTAPPAAEAKGPQAAPKPEPKRAPTEVPAPAPPKPVTPASRSHHEPIKEAKREIAPKPRKRISVNRAPGEKWREGDPYLNHLLAMIESHRFYPSNAIGPLGLHLQGTAYFLLTLMPNGSIADLRIESSTHSPVLDDAARAMIERAAPFPPLPRYFPQDGATFTVVIPLFPPLR